MPLLVGLTPLTRKGARGPLTFFRDPPPLSDSLTPFLGALGPAAP